MKKIALEQTDYKTLVNFLQKITVPFGQSIEAANALIALNNAKEIEIEEKELKDNKKINDVR